MNVYAIGCLHLGHEAVARWRGFQNSEEHDTHLISQWNSVVNKKDLVYVLGDITMEKPDCYYKLDLLNGRKRVVMGNHDLFKDVPELLKYVEGVAGMIDYKGYVLTHAPIHPNEAMFYKANIHAHIHHLNVLPELPSIPYEDTHHLGPPKYINVDARLIDFKPVNLTTIHERL